MDAPEPFAIEEVARFPLPGMTQPTDIAFSPDDRWVTYLWSAEGGPTRQLYAYDPNTGEQRVVVQPPAGEASDQNLSLEEALRRERARQLGTGVTRYAWARHANRLLIPLQVGVCVQDGIDAPLRVVIPRGEHPAIDPQISPDGAWVAYVQDGELHAVSADGGSPRQLTFGGRENGCVRGVAEYIAQEEMGRAHGFWWSADGRWLAFAEVDESHVPLYHIAHQGKDLTGEAAQEEHRYPFAGAANAVVRLGVISVDGGSPLWLDLGPDEDIYLARVDWAPDGNLLVQVENREQTSLDLLRFNPRTAEKVRLLRETSDVWINLHDLLRPLRSSDREHSGGFVWASERTGFRHLYLYDRNGRLIRPLTAGEWQVDDVAAVDEERELIYVTATRESPIESHLYAVSMAGGEPRRLTREPGTHAVVVDRARRRWIDVFQSVDAPPTLTLRSLSDGEVIRSVYDQPDPRVSALELRAPDLVALGNRDGVELHGALYRPDPRFGAGPYPTIVSVYGGPHAQQVTNSWRPTAAMRAQYLRGLGYLVFVLDNRGSARRGLGFEGAIKHRMGQLEVQDQVDGVRWLVEQGLADPGRVGVYGWSYGGYMAAMGLAQAPDTFKVAVAGAPVVNWDGYDTHYTERYMGTPESNPDGYRAGAVTSYVERIVGKLLLVHGLIDENVHFRHTARLINALIRARKRYELLLFPDERHLPRHQADRIYLEERIRDFFRENL
jgi:dipeptidyl-peptidase-4